MNKLREVEFTITLYAFEFKVHVRLCKDSFIYVYGLDNLSNLTDVLIQYMIPRYSKISNLAVLVPFIKVCSNSNLLCLPWSKVITIPIN